MLGFVTRSSVTPRRGFRHSDDTGIPDSSPGSVSKGFPQHPSGRSACSGDPIRGWQSPGAGCNASAACEMQCQCATGKVGGEKKTSCGSLECAVSERHAGSCADRGARHLWPAQAGQRISTHHLNRNPHVKLWRTQSSTSSRCSARPRIGARSSRTPSLTVRTPCVRRSGRHTCPLTRTVVLAAGDLAQPSSRQDRR